MFIGTQCLDLNNMNNMGVVFIGAQCLDLNNMGVVFIWAQCLGLSLLSEFPKPNEMS